MSNELRHTSSSAMRDSITDYNVAEHLDNDEAKRMKFEYTRYKIIKVYIRFLNISISFK